MITRPSKDEMFMAMAMVASRRSTCARTQVGCIITDMNGTQVVSIGYNGNAKGLPNHCDTSTPGQCGCLHAEDNALLKAPYNQGSLVLYTTLSPCSTCSKRLLNTQVVRVVCAELYRNWEPGVELLRDRIEFQHLKSFNLKWVLGF